jgi:hypothetical protein
LLHSESEEGGGDEETRKPHERGGGGFARSGVCEQKRAGVRSFENAAPPAERQ